MSRAFTTATNWPLWYAVAPTSSRCGIWHGELEESLPGGLVCLDVDEHNSLDRAWCQVQPEGALLVWSDPRAEHGLRRAVANLQPAPLYRQRFVELDVLGEAKVALPTAPLAIAHAARATLPANRWISRAAREAYGLLARLGVARCLPTRSIHLISAATAPADDSPLAALSGRLPQPAHVAVHSGLPGATQKLNVRLLGEAGELLAIAKIAAHQGADRSVHREAHTLTSIASTGPLLRCRVPRLIDSGTIGERPYLVQSIVEGCSTTDIVVGVPDQRVLDLLRVLAQTTQNTIPYGSAEGVVAVRERVARVIEQGLPPWPRLLERLQQRVDALAPKTLRSVLVHRDFTPWNILLTKARANVVDWEFAQRQHVPLFDFLHYIVQHATLVAGLNADIVIPKCRAALADDRLMAALGRAPLSARERQFALAFYLLDTVSFYQANYLESRPTFWQVEWLEGVWFNMCAQVLDEPMPS